VTPWRGAITKKKYRQVKTKQVRTKKNYKTTPVSACMIKISVFWTSKQLRASRNYKTTAVLARAIKIFNFLGPGKQVQTSKNYKTTAILARNITIFLGDQASMDK
jgi:hypothetical protein